MSVVEVRYYATAGGNSPFESWFWELDPPARWRIMARLERLERGHFGDVKNIGAGIFEIRIFFGPGYRIYLGRNGHELILLCAGDKASQRRDISLAQKYWEDYRSQNEKK